MDRSASLRFIVRVTNAMTVAAATALALVACGSEPDEPPDEVCTDLEESIGLSIGVTTESGFMPLQDDDPMELFIGFQGGIMLAPALRARNVQPGQPEEPSDNPTVHWTIHIEDEMRGELLYRTAMKPVPDESGAYEVRGLPILLRGVTTTTARDLVGMRAEINLEVTDAFCRTGTATLAVRPYLPDP